MLGARVFLRRMTVVMAIAQQRVQLRERFFEQGRRVSKVFRGRYGRAGAGYSWISHWGAVFRKVCTSLGQTVGVFVRPGRRLLIPRICIDADVHR